MLDWASRHMSRVSTNKISFSINSTKIWHDKRENNERLFLSNHIFNSELRKAFPNGFLFESVANGGIPANIATPDLSHGFHMTDSPNIVDSPNFVDSPKDLLTLSLLWYLLFGALFLREIDYVGDRLPPPRSVILIY